MKFFSIYIIFFFLFFFSQSQKPQNILIFDINCYDFRSCFYEFTVPKDEIFGFQFSKARGTPSHWQLLNRNFYNGSYNIQFLNSSIYDYISEEYEKRREKEKKEAEARGLPYYEKGISGGNEYYYEIFKALKETNHPITLKFTYDFLWNPRTNVTIDIWICDSIYKDKCINNNKTKCVYDKENKKCISKNLCDKIEQVSESSCNNAITITPSLTKCAYEKSGEEPNIVEKCVIKKVCSSSLSEEECNSVLTLNPETTKCIFNYEHNKCEIKEICELEENPSLNICNGILTSNPSKTKCIYDKINNRCQTKNICSKIDFPSKEICEDALTSNEELICIFDEYKNECTERMVCSLVLNEPEMNCEKATTLNNKTKCVYDEIGKKCKEENKTLNKIIFSDDKNISYFISLKNGNFYFIFYLLFFIFIIDCY